MVIDIIIYGLEQIWTDKCSNSVVQIEYLVFYVIEKYEQKTQNYEENIENL